VKLRRPTTPLLAAALVPTLIAVAIDLDFNGYYYG
jgi:hypothetical protein